jgi:SAM-dependent methyltransferase
VIADHRCPVCQSENVRLYLDDEENSFDPAIFGSSRVKITHGRILRCDDCEFGFRQARSNPSEMAELYRQMDTGVYESETEGRKSTAIRHLQVLRRFAGTKPGRLLDAGCASGAFLQEACDAGWSVAGAEPSETLFAKAQSALGDKADLHCCVLEQAPFPAASFDAVTLWDVLEHVPDPAGFMRLCRDLLKPGGKLFVNVPDLDSFEARTLGRRWPLLLAEHLNYFNRASLRLCAEKAGLQWIHFGRRSASFSVEYILFRLSQHRIPGAKLASRLVGGRIAKMQIPMYLGEILGVWSRP